MRTTTGSLPWKTNIYPSGRLQDSYDHLNFQTSFFEMLQVAELAAKEKGIWLCFRLGVPWKRKGPKRTLSIPWPKMRISWFFSEFLRAYNRFTELSNVNSSCETSFSRSVFTLVKSEERPRKASFTSENSVKRLQARKNWEKNHESLIFGHGMLNFRLGPFLFWDP